MNYVDIVIIVRTMSKAWCETQLKLKYRLILPNLPGLVARSWYQILRAMHLKYELERGKRGLAPWEYCCKSHCVSRNKALVSKVYYYIMICSHFYDFVAHCSSIGVYQGVRIYVWNTNRRVSSLKTERKSSLVLASQHKEGLCWDSGWGYS